MKGVLVILDGLGDLPCKVLGDRTPLEAAETPNSAFLLTRGESGYMYPIKPGVVPGSDESLVSIFDNDLFSSSRGQIEAMGVGLNLVRGDLALRVNFGTIDSLNNGNIIDRLAGRTLTTEEANSLAKAINKMEFPSKFIFIPTIQHRGVLVFKGGFSETISGNDPFPSNDKIKKCKPLNEDENSQYAVNVVNEFLDKSFHILKNHPVNENRIRKGLLPANYFFIRGPGVYIPKLRQYRKWVSLGYMPTEIGFSKLSGMKTITFDYPKLKDLDAYENLWDGLKKACKYATKMIKKHALNYDYAYIHIKETDLPGHDNKPIEKKLMIEYIDKTLIKFLREFCPPRKIRVAITGDHSTPCKLKSHSADPVPVLFYNDSIPRLLPNFGFSKEKSKGKKFSEKEARKGNLGRIIG